MTPPFSHAPPNQILNDRYRVMKELGRGGMGCVYLVEDMHRRNLSLALKTMLKHGTDRDFLDGFRTEFAELAKLRHPNIGAAYDFGRIAGTGEYFFTTEFIDGIDILKGTPQATFEQVLDIIIQILRGLEFIHSHNLLHNDLKPANILLSAPEGQGRGSARNLSALEAAIYGYAGRVKIIDFGLLSRVNVKWDQIRGTPRYVSPERIRCRPADGRSDLYSLGCIAYLLASRRFPYADRNTRKLLRQHLDGRPTSLATLCPTAPPAFIQCVNKLMEKDPEQRFSTAGEALDFLTSRLSADTGAGEVHTKTGTPELAAGSLLHRDAEIAKLKGMFVGVKERTADSVCVVVEGDPGVGKTRLAEELRSYVQVSGGAFLNVAARAVEGHLRPVLRSIVADLRMSGITDLPGETEEFISSSRSKTFDGSQAASFFLEDLIMRCARSLPIVVHFDDFHNASEGVRMFAIELAHSASEKLNEFDSHPRVMVILSQRHKRGTDRIKISGFETIELAPFTTEQINEFLERIFSRSEIPDHVREHLLTAAEGNLQFLLEIAKDLVDNGHVRHTGTKWEFPESFSDISMPDSVRGAVENRLASLGNESVSILEWLSLARFPLPARILTECIGSSPGRTQWYLERLAKQGILSTADKELGPPFGGDEADQGTTFQFSYRDVQDFILEQLSDARRTFIHQRLAHALEQDGRNMGYSTSDELAEHLAYHWLESGNEAGFLRFADEAASTLQRCGSLDAALDYRQRIVAALPDEAATKKIQSIAKLAEMHEFKWDLTSSLAHLHKILKLAGRLLKAKDRSALFRRMAMMELSRNDPEGALRLISKARVASDPEDTLAALLLDATEASAQYMVKRPLKGTALLDKVSKVVGKYAPAGDRERTLLVALLNQVANLHSYLGGLTNAIRLQRRCVELIDQMDSAGQAQAACWCSLGGSLLDAGEVEEAETYLLKALRKGKEIGDLRTLCRARERLGEYHLLYGNLKRALQVTQVGLQDAKSIQHEAAAANNLRMLGRIYRRAGQTNEAAAVLKRAATKHEAHDPLNLAASRIELAHLYIGEKQSKKARTHLELAESHARQHGQEGALAMCRLAYARLEMQVSGRLCEDELHKAEVFFADSGYRRALCEIEILRCQHLQRRRKWDQSKWQLDKLQSRLHQVASNDQRLEIKFLASRQLIGRKQNHAAARSLLALQQEARNALHAELAARTKNLLDELVKTLG